MSAMDLIYSAQLDTITLVDSPAGICRDRYGWFNITFFQLWACSHCYTYLFHSHIETEISRSVLAVEIMDIAGTTIPPLTVLYPDLFDGANIKDKNVCAVLGQDNCKQLTSCCSEAIKCCSGQTRSLNLTNFQADQDGPLSCPRTWDGLACIPQTSPGELVEFSCPSYLGDNMDNGAVGRKLCTRSGTWATDPTSGRERTDYSSCSSLQSFRILYYTSVSCNAVSLLCLVPACIIFITFKQLHKQHRIRIHLNLFVSLILTNCAWLGWYHLIYRDRLDNPKETAVIYKKTFQDTCKILYVISRYSWTCNSVWMLLEGFHLYRLTNHAFKAPKSIVSYYFIGWLAPLVPTSVYSIVRLVEFDSGCWVKNAHGLEWIMYGPVLLCVLSNVVFFTVIMRTLLTQVQCHPNEPSNYRRALKATFILVPLFGLQLFTVVYRPDVNIIGSLTYEIIAEVISNSQGAAVAIVFCFLNCEVHSQIYSHFSWSRTRHSAHDARSCTLTTEMRGASPRDARLESIPLNCTSLCHGSINGSIGDKRSNSSVLSLKLQHAQQEGTSVKEQMV